MSVRTILIVDDETEIRRTLGLALQRAVPDATIHVARDGPEALLLLAKERVDVILADYRMPGMDGLTFLEEAAKLQRGAKRMLMTAYADVPVATRAINGAHVHRLIPKPFQLREVAALVRDALDLASQEGQAARALAATLRDAVTSSEKSPP